MTHNHLSRDLPQHWRLASTGSGREVVLAAATSARYLNRYSGEKMAVIGRLLPLAPSSPRLPWAAKNLRFFPTCEQLVQKDLDSCPYAGRPLPPLETHLATNLDETIGSS